MASTFTWLDYSEHERQKMLDVIELFGERTTRDELGLGGVRDAFADLLFPGTSTIQTRAKYFLLVPWCYLALERKRVGSAEIAERARRLELQLVRSLEDAGETQGLIGRLAGEQLQRLPSSVYWQGMLVLGIRMFSGSQSEYHRSLDMFHARQRETGPTAREVDGDALAGSMLHNWNPGLPPIPPAFPKHLAMSLTADEAAFLREQVLTNCPDSLMAWLLRELFDTTGYRFAWELAGEVPETFRQQLEHGQNFSEVMHGAQLLYNLMLAEQTTRQDWIDRYHTALADWWQTVSARMHQLHDWDRTSFWQLVYRCNPRIGRARTFIDRWTGQVLSADLLDDIVDRPACRELVEDREVHLKKGLARLRSSQARGNWTGAAGAAQLDLRWASARRIIDDIVTGLKASADA